MSSPLCHTHSHTHHYDQLPRYHELVTHIEHKKVNLTMVYYYVLTISDFIANDYTGSPWSWAL